MVIDGKQIASELKEKIKQDVAARAAPPTLFVFMAGENPVSERFLGIKKKFAADIGVTVEERRYPETIDTLRLASEIQTVGAEDNRGIIVQLPLPEALNVNDVLSAIPAHKDPDVLSPQSVRMFENGRLPVIPPVVGAFAEILKRENVEVEGKKVVLIGRGRLVGRPALVWFSRHGGEVEALDERTPDLSRYTSEADIIVLGAGSPGLLEPEMIKDGVVILDAGTSEAEGKLQGDAAPECAEKASVFTPVPGGIGPITVAKLFENLLILTESDIPNR